MPRLPAHPNRINNEGAHEVAGDPECATKHPRGVVEPQTLGTQAHEVHAMELGETVRQDPFRAIAENVRVDHLAGDAPQ